MRNRINRFHFKSLVIAGVIVLSCETEELTKVDEHAAFLSFVTNEQTLPTHINSSSKVIRLEVSHDADITQLTPEFDVPEGYSVSVNGTDQVSGQSAIDFSEPVTYTIKNSAGEGTLWEVEVVPLNCKILIDASHDGGVWWFPQHEGTGFNPNESHQGKAFADHLRDKGFEVTELGRGTELREEMFFGHYIVIRVGGFQAYSSQELDVYTNLLGRGMNLVFFTDHKRYDPVDELGDLLDLEFKGVANGTITNFTTHEITAEMTSLNYIAGSVITNAEEHPDMEVLGWLGENDFADLNFDGIKDSNEPVASPVMGILNYPNSKIFFIGDTNGIEVQTQPFIDNLIGWMGHCFLN